MNLPALIAFIFLAVFLGLYGFFELLGDIEAMAKFLVGLVKWVGIVLIIWIIYNLIRIHLSP